jgi:hypothetical protein
MKKIAHSLLLIGLSCWFLGGCVGADIEDTDEAFVLAEDTPQEQEVLSHGEEDLSASELEGEGDYSTEVCSGWAGYGSACRVKCNNGVWYTVGYHPNIGYGDCTAAGRGFCAAWGMNATGHCWN